MNSLNAVLRQQIGIDDYFAWSTAVSTLLFIPIMPSIFLGYLIVLFNCVLLVLLDRLTIHRNHVISIALLAGFSVIGAFLAGGGVKPIIAQILGITVTSVYYLNALTTFGISLNRWMEMYVRVAFIVAIFGIFQWVAAKIVHVGDGRLHSLYSEPALYIFVTLPAIGYCVSRFFAARQYGWEALVFFATFILADSSLGFLGLLLISALIVMPRLKGWHMLLAATLLCGMIGALYTGSQNFRLRITDTVFAVANQDLGRANASTFALLSNVYVTSQSFLAHPLTGVGIGGYAKAYDTYVGNISEEGSAGFYLRESLNRDDANSLFLRVTAELGVPGLFVLLGFLIVCARVGTPHHQTIRNAILPYLLIRMGRFGAYFSVEFYFFVGLYLFNYMQSRSRARQAQLTRRSET